MKQFICFVLALALLAASLLMLYPQLLGGEKTLNLVDSYVPSDYAPWKMGVKGLESFPMYGNEETGFYGIKDVMEDVSAFIKSGEAERPDIWGYLTRIPQNAGFLQALYALVILILVSIPVYMVLRLICYNPLYKWIGEKNLLVRLPLRGLATMGMGITCVSAAWLITNQVLFKSLLEKLIEWIKGVTDSLPLALSSANITAIILITCVVLGLLKVTVFRGSFGLSVLLALLRVIIFTVFFAYVSVFWGEFSLRIILFGAAFMIVCGVVENVLDK
ncbi:MAG: hypothetical protein IKV51_02610 [Clostridia bacterium]|nr:hypothetical protein [Clostridia bacterium]